MPFTDAMKAEPTFSAARGSLITFSIKLYDLRSPIYDRILM